MKNITVETKTKMGKEVIEFTERFGAEYGHTPQRTEFFSEALPRFAERVFEENIDLNKELWGFIDDYKDRGLGGFNATYGNLYHWLIDFAADLLGVDVFELRSSVIYK